jgi:predicted ATPase
LVTRSEKVRILATSQQPLGVPGEVEWPVPPLDVVEPGADVAPEQAAHSPAVRLFCLRAALAKPGFAPGPADLDAIVEICRRLDANPLAIELAAARVRSLSAPEIAARLERRFQLLQARPGATDARYGSLTAALAWSHDLLTGPEKALLRRLSVFHGTFGIDAVEDVCSGGEVHPDDVVELLTGVIAKSFVTADVTGPTARYRFPETVGVYAAHHLEAAGESAEVGERHARWYLRLVEAAAEAGEPGPASRGRRCGPSTPRWTTSAPPWTGAWPTTAPSSACAWPPDTWSPGKPQAASPRPGSGSGGCWPSLPTPPPPSALPPSPKLGSQPWCWASWTPPGETSRRAWPLRPRPATRPR